MFKHKKIIIFDMDGTLIDSVGIWNSVDLELRRALGMKDEISLSHLQQQRDDALRRFSKDENPYLSYCAYLKELYKSDKTAEEIHDLRYSIAQTYLKNSIDYKEGADIFIRKLYQKGFTLVIASTTKKSNMEIYRTQNQNIMQKANIDDYFRLVFTREDAKEMKPHPEIYLKVLKELGVSAKDALVFEDSLIGIEAAKAAGIESVLVYDAYSEADREKILELADYSINSFYELTERL